LHRVNDPAFLLRHKRELETFWIPKYNEVIGEPETTQDDDDGRFDAWA
jgi:hypothetical protein